MVCALRGAGERLTCTGGLLGPAPLTSDGTRNSDGSSSLPVPEEEAEVLPGDKSLQTLPFSLGGKVLLSEPLSLQGSMCPSDFPVCDSGGFFHYPQVQAVVCTFYCINQLGFVTLHMN